MKRKDYQKPTMQIVKLQQSQQILAGSVEAQRSSYGSANGTGEEDIWEEEDVFDVEVED